MKYWLSICYIILNLHGCINGYSLVIFNRCHIYPDTTMIMFNVQWHKYTHASLDCDWSWVRFLVGQVKQKAINLVFAFCGNMWTVASGVMVRALNATFNNIKVISWLSVLFMEETGENHQFVASHWQILSHNAVSSTPRH